MKNLKTIQTTAKVLKIITNIIFIFMIVGAAISVVTIPILVLGKNYMINIKDIKILFTDAKINYDKDVIGNVIASAFACTAGSVIFGFANDYLKTELIDGTPFTVRGADKLRQLAILTIVLPIVSIIITSIILACFSMESKELTNDYHLITGLVLLLVSVVCRYGAELEAKAHTLPRKSPTERQNNL